MPYCSFVPVQISDSAKVDTVANGLQEDCEKTDKKISAKPDEILRDSSFCHKPGTQTRFVQKCFQWLMPNVHLARFSVKQVTYGFVYARTEEWV